LKVKTSGGITMDRSNSRRRIVNRLLAYFLAFFLILGAFVPYLPAKAAGYINRRLILTTAPSDTKREPRTKPIEKEEKRTEKSKTFHNPDGTFTINYYTRPIHVKDKMG
jgi:hypothetical protein